MHLPATSPYEESRVHRPARWLVRGLIGTVDWLADGGSVPSCRETASGCDVEVDTTGIGCDGFCEAHGGECHVADCKGSTAACDYCEVGINCGLDNGVAICACSRGCGSGPPCVSPLVCNAGICS